MPIEYNQSGVTYDSAIYTYDGDAYAPSVFPVVGVYIAWNDGPYVASPAWTEITQYVRNISIRRGRADDFEQFDTGTAQLVLDNRARTFDPFYTSGPYYLKLTPRRQIRVVGQIGGTLYEVFRGYVAGWPVSWSEAGYDSTVTIQAFDALGLMANEIVPTDWTLTYTEALNPFRYFRCSDAQTTGVLVDISNRDTIRNANSPTTPGFFEFATLGKGLQASSAACASYNNFSGAYPTAPVTGSNDFSVSFLVQFAVPTSVSGGWVGYVSTQYGGRRLRLRFFYKDDGAIPANTLQLDTQTFSGTPNTYAVSYTASTATPLHVVLTYTAATNVGKIYINASDVTGAPTAGVAALSFNDRMIFDVINAVVQEYAFYQRVLTQTEITTLYNYASGRLQETTTARMDRLIGTTDFPAALEAFTASPVATVSEIGSGRGVIPEMQLVADSEGGELYVSKAGLLTATSRFDVFNATRSANVQATLTDSGVGLRYGPDVTIEYDGDNLKNDITVTFSGDGEVNAYSDAVIEAYGGAATTIETQLADPTSAAQLAAMELGVEGSLVPRISPIDVSVNTAAADWQTILGLELLDRVTFKRTPSVGNQFSRDALINAIEHQIEPGVWRTQLTLSMRYTSPLTLDDDVLGTLDFNYLG